MTFYGPRSDYVATGSDCGYIFIWDKKSEALVQTKHADENGMVSYTVILEIVSLISYIYSFHKVIAIEPHPHLPTLATCGIDKTIKIWEPLNKCQNEKLPKLKLVSLYLNCLFLMKMLKYRNKNTQYLFKYLK